MTYLGHHKGNSQSPLYTRCCLTAPPSTLERGGYQIEASLLANLTRHIWQRQHFFFLPFQSLVTTLARFNYEAHSSALIA